MKTATEVDRHLRYSGDGARHIVPPTPRRCIDRSSTSTTFGSS
jgi:hypothetical protein